MIMMARFLWLLISYGMENAHKCKWSVVAIADLGEQFLFPLPPERYYFIFGGVCMKMESKYHANSDL